MKTRMSAVAVITLKPAELDQLTINTLRFLSVDAVEKANSGYPGLPIALILTRQDVPTLDRTQVAAADGLRRGAYVLADAANGKPDVILIATGSEVSLIVAA